MKRKKYKGQEELDLIQKAKDGDRKAMGDLIESWMPAIIRRTNSWRGNPQIDPRDLEQEGAIAVMQAVEGFDPNRGNGNFSTFLKFFWQGTIHLSAVKELAQGRCGITAIARFQNSILQKAIIEEDTLEDAVQNCGLTRSIAIGALRLMQEIQSLDAEDDSERTLYDRTPGEQYSTEGNVHRLELREALEAALEQLTPLQRDTIRKLYLEPNPCSGTELSRERGVKHQAVFDLESRAIKKLRKMLQGYQEELQ